MSPCKDDVFTFCLSNVASSSAAESANQGTQPLAALPPGGTRVLTAAGTRLGRTAGKRARYLDTWTPGVSHCVQTEPTRILSGFIQTFSTFLFQTRSNTFRQLQVGGNNNNKGINIYSEYLFRTLCIIKCLSGPKYSYMDLNSHSSPCPCPRITASIIPLIYLFIHSAAL